MNKRLTILLVVLTALLAGAVAFVVYMETRPAAQMPQTVPTTAATESPTETTQIPTTAVPETEAPTTVPPTETEPPETEPPGDPLHPDLCRRLHPGQRPG